MRILLGCAVLGIYLLGTTIGISSIASAATYESTAGSYLSLNLGPVFLSDATNSGSLLDLESEYESGFMLSGALGYAFEKGVRIEGELSYRKNDIDTLSITRVGNISGLSIGDSSSGGDVTSFSIMANGYIDFDLVGPIAPFVMGGVGTSLVSVNDVTGFGIKIADDDDWVFAYQFGAGFRYKLSEKLSIEGSYRFFQTSDPELKDVAGDSFDSEYQSHNFLFGVSIKF